MESYQGKASQNERGRLSIPQVYVQLQFGVSWSQRHTPQSHTMTYMSKSLRKSSDFPRQGGPSVSKPVGKQSPGQSRPRDANGAHHRKPVPKSHNAHGSRRPDERRQNKPVDPTRLHTKKSDAQRQHRSEARGPSHDRGSSAPPISHNNPWIGNADLMTPAVPQTSRAPRQSTPPHVWKTLPAPPSQFRLGADGLPWSSWAYPEGFPASDEEQEIEEEAAPFANKPTTINLSSPEARLERRHTDDPTRVLELEKLSLAMVTVDNGFENQWWYQGDRENTDWLTHGIDSTEVLYSPQSDPGDNRLVSALEETPITGPEWPATHDKNAGMRMMVSPISENSMSSAGSFRPIQRSLTTRSEELFIGL